MTTTKTRLPKTLEARNNALYDAQDVRVRCYRGASLEDPALAAEITRRWNAHDELVRLLADLQAFLVPRKGFVDLARGGDASCFHRDIKKALTRLTKEAK